MMNLKFSSFICLSSLLFSGVLSVRIIEQNHYEVTVKVGDEVELVCTSETEVKACNFRDPNENTMSIFEGARYEGGRISKYGSGPKDCGIRISDLQDKDHGQWECSVTGLTEDGNLSVGKGFINVTVAVAPTAVSLRVDDEPVTSPMLKLKLDEAASKKVSCIAESARPKPIFKWYLGNAEYEGERTSEIENEQEDGKANFIDTVTYFAEASHNKQTLKCVVEHMGYLDFQRENEDNIAKIDLELFFRPQEKSKAVQEFYELHEGEANDIRMTFSANPKPNDGFWIVNNEKLAIGSESLDGKYKSSFIEDGDLPGDYFVTLTINDLQKEDVHHENELQITNDEGTTTYKFILEIGSKPPAAGTPGMPISSQGASAAGPIIAVVILVLILIVIIGFVAFAKVKGMFCFAVKRKGGEDPEEAVVKEGSDTESAEDHGAGDGSAGGEPEAAEAGVDSPDHKEKSKTGSSVATRFSNFFASVKKSVASKGTNSKDKYATQEQGEAETKLNEDNERKLPDDITYADIDTTALGQGTLPAENGNSDEDKTQYAVIKHQ